MAKTNRELAFDFFDNMFEGQVIAIKEIAKKDPEAFKGYLRDYIDKGGLITQKEKKQVYDKWKSLVNMTYTEL